MNGFLRNLKISWRLHGGSSCKNWERVTDKDDKKLKVCMLYDMVMRSIQNSHKRIKHMNSFINAKLQRKQKMF